MCITFVTLIVAPPSGPCTQDPDQPREGDLECVRREGGGNPFIPKVDKTNEMKLIKSSKRRNKIGIKSKFNMLGNCWDTFRDFRLATKTNVTRSPDSLTRGYTAGRDALKRGVRK